MKKTQKPKPATITVESKLAVGDAIALCIDKVGAKKLLRAIFLQCFNNTIMKCGFPANLLATKEDEEMAVVAAALHYLEQNWEQAVDEGIKLLSKKLESKQS